MKIAVILTEFLKDYVKSYFDSLSEKHELSYYTYQNFKHAGELYLLLEKEFDGFLVSGPVPRAAICRAVPVLTKPVVSFGSNALCYYETFFQILYKEQDFRFEKGYFDLLEWNSDSPKRPLHDYLKNGQFNQLIYKIYKNTSSYTLEQLIAMEEKIKDKHIRLWKEGSISYSVTRFSNIMPDLINAGVKTYFVYPKPEIMQESLSLLLQEIHLKSILQNQTTIAALNQQFSDRSPVLPAGSTSIDESEDPQIRLRSLSQKTGLSIHYIQRLLSALSVLDQEHITAQILAAALDITPRSANRLLVRLVDRGVAEVISNRQSFTRGRPEKIYCIHL